MIERLARLISPRKYRQETEFDWSTFDAATIKPYNDLLLAIRGPSYSATVIDVLKVPPIVAGANETYFVRIRVSHPAMDDDGQIVDHDDSGWLPFATLQQVPLVDDVVTLHQPPDDVWYVGAGE